MTESISKIEKKSSKKFVKPKQKMLYKKNGKFQNRRFENPNKIPINKETKDDSRGIKRKHVDDQDEDDEIKDEDDEIKEEDDDGASEFWTKFKEDRKVLKKSRHEHNMEVDQIYNISVNGKMIWEELRQNNCPVERREVLCDELFEILKGNLKKLSKKNASSRVIQTLIERGQDKHRSLVFDELRNDFVELVGTKYAFNIVEKFLKVGSSEQKSAIIVSMYGKITLLMKNKISSKLVDHMYNELATPDQRRKMIQEFYGPTFRHFKEDVKSLKEVMAKSPDANKVLTEVKFMLMDMISKGLYVNTMIHTLLKEFVGASDVKEMECLRKELVEGLPPIVHTQDGAYVAMHCIWHGSAKERKEILKSFKGHYVKMACDDQGYKVLFAMFDCIDDTVLVNKVALSELMASIDTLAKSNVGMKVLWYLVSPRNKRLVHPSLMATLREGDSNAYTKKPSEKRYAELQESIASFIYELVHKNFLAWIEDSHKILFIVDSLRTLPGSECEPIFDDLVGICNRAFVPGDSTHFLNSGLKSGLFKEVLHADAVRHEKGWPLFSSKLIGVVAEDLRSWCVVNRGSFLLVKLYETEAPQVIKDVHQICLPAKSSLKKFDFPGAEILLKKIKEHSE